MLRVMDEYFVRKRKGQRIDNCEMKALWKSALERGKSLGKENKDEIFKNSKEPKDKSDG